MVLSKRQAHKRKVWFKKGSVSPKKGQTVVFPTVGDKNYVRLEKKAFESRVHTTNNVLTFKILMVRTQQCQRCDPDRMRLM